VPSERGYENQLLRDGVVDESRLGRAREEASAKGLSLIETILALGYATEEDVYRSLASFCEFRFVLPTKMKIEESMAEMAPARYASHYRFAPIEERNGTLVIALTDPLNTHLLDDIRMVLKRRVEPTVTTPKELQQTLKQLYGVGADTVERIMSDHEAAGHAISLDGAVTSADLGDVQIDASVIKFANELLAEAINTGATDVHIEPFEDVLRVRYRIDGILHQVPVPASIRGFHAAIVSRVKIMANLNIAERRLPQDGKILAKLSDEQFDLRVSILPTPHGETVNIRVLNRGSMFMSLEELGFKQYELRQFLKFVENPHGMILVTGPTGSGKTTTLYAALAKLNKIDRKVITVEDPIEYQLKGITQMQVQEQVGFNFSRALRSMLRHDPDIMLVGEIRDYETAEMAIRSSLTGHLVFSTLHTNDAAGAVTRLTDMGVEPFLISSTMIASIAQRLVRRTCSDCGHPVDATPELLASVERTVADIPADATFRKGEGCEHCRYTGYRGRQAIYEILPFTREIKTMTVERRPSTEIKQVGRQQGMKTLREAGWERVCDGTTTFEEILRVTAESEAESALEVQHAPVPV